MSNLKLIHGSCADQTADAIVNAANSGLWKGGGICGVIFCKCGSKATVNARFDDDGNIVYEGDQIVLGGNGRYEAMCRKCWLKAKKEQEERAKK